MAKKPFYVESELAALAKQFREQAGKSKAAVGRELGVSRPSMQDAEEHPERSMNSLRLRIIEACSPYRVEGPLYRLVKKRASFSKPSTG
jgi:DNA-binding XRE family transcriptional regulator